MSTKANRHPAVIAERLTEVADHVCRTMRAFGLPWSMSKSLRTVKAWHRGAHRLSIEQYIMLRVEHNLDRPSRQRLRDTLRAALWYNDLTGITATLNADGDKRPNKGNRY